MWLLRYAVNRDPYTLGRAVAITLRQGGHAEDWMDTEPVEAECEAASPDWEAERAEFEAEEEGHNG